MATRTTEIAIWCALRDASWLNARRIRDYPIILIVAQLAMVGWILSGTGINDPAGRPIGADFLSFWTVSWALLHGHWAAIYVPPALATLEATVLPRADHAFYAWQYPPTALLIVAPLACLPYLGSLASWIGLGLGTYALALHRIVLDRRAILPVFAFPALWVSITHGQTSLIAAPLLTWGLIVLTEYPSLSGILFGLLSFKPQFAILIPVALVTGRHWRALASAAGTALVLVVVTLGTFGSEIWVSFIRDTTVTRAILDDQLVPYYKMQSVFAAGRLLGMPLSLSYGLQALASAAAALCVAWVWRGGGSPALKKAALAAAVPLGSPFFLDYDLLVLAPAIAWTVTVMLQTGARPWEKSTLAAAFILPLFARVSGEQAHLPVTPVVVIALLSIIVTRLRAERSSSNHPAGTS